MKKKKKKMKKRFWKKFSKNLIFKKKMPKWH